jgi:hypothetical protein
VIDRADCPTIRVRVDAPAVGVTAVACPAVRGDGSSRSSTPGLTAGWSMRHAGRRIVDATRRDCHGMVGVVDPDG